MASGRRRRRLFAAFSFDAWVAATARGRREADRTRLDAVGGRGREPRRRRRFRETTRTPTNKSRHKTRRRRRETTNTRKTQERRWKAWWAGQGHPTCVNNTNLERYIPDCPVDVSYDAEVSQELHGPDNLPRLEEEDDEDEDDLLLEEILERLKWDALLPKFEDEDWARGRC